MIDGLLYKFIEKGLVPAVCMYTFLLSVTQCAVIVLSRPVLGLTENMALVIALYRVSKGRSIKKG